MFFSRFPSLSPQPEGDEGLLLWGGGVLPQGQGGSATEPSRSPGSDRARLGVVTSDPSQPG